MKKLGFKFFSFVFTAALFTSLFLNVWLAKQAIIGYRQKAIHHLQPIANQLPFEQKCLSSSDEWNSIVALFGDSRISDWPNISNRDGLRFENLGLKDRTTAELLHWLNLAQWDTPPEIMVLQAGINDLKYIGVLPDQREKIVTDCKRNIQSMADWAEARNITCVVLTIIPTSKPSLKRSMVWSSDVDEAIREVNKFIRDMANSQVHVFDCDELFLKDQYIDSQYSRDMLHLNDLGYDKLESQLIPILEKILEDSH